MQAIKINRRVLYAGRAPSKRIVPGWSKRVAYYIRHAARRWAGRFTPARRAEAERVAARCLRKQYYAAIR